MTYRVYFHKRSGNDPVVWSVDEGTQETETHVQFFQLLGVRALSVVDLEAKAGAPSGWIQVEGAAVEFARGGAIFTKRPGA